jgi:hypothetical protein
MSAPSFPDPPPFEGAGGLMPASVPVQLPAEYYAHAPSTAPPYQPFNYEPPPLDRNAVESAYQAAGTGQKELFDAAVMSGYLEPTRDDLMIDRHLGKLLAATDAAGKLLVSLYWRGKQWQARYGKADLPAIEDQLRNFFEMAGDLVLTLRTKEVEALPVGEAETDIDETSTD